MAQRLIGCAAALFLVATSPVGRAAHAQALSDPTRPPSAQAASSVATPELAEARLQSILISPSRKVAVIDGMTVPLGGTIDGAVLVAIRESEVVLQKGAERETLKLNPGVWLRPVPRAARARETK